MICTHTFLKVGEKTKPVPSALGHHRGTPGVEAVCVNCGQVRHVWADGVVEIVHPGSEPIDEDSHDITR